MTTLLEGIDTPDTLRELRVSQLPNLAHEIRETILRFCTAHGGHLGSNLGAVELTIALHYVFQSPEDRIIFDVSHQCYTHKILTGRANAFRDPEAFGSVSGFTCRAESPHDHFDLGHTGTSVSLATGLAITRNLSGQHHRVIGVIGDGSLSSGTALEGLNCAVQVKGQLMIVCNDNEMAIDENVGGLYGNLSELRNTQGNSSRNVFKDFGLDYRYVEDGNDTGALVQAFTSAAELDHPVVVHVHTRKGLGIERYGVPGMREGHDSNNHWCDPVPQEASTSKAVRERPNARWTYGSMAMSSLLPRFRDEPSLVVISPATSASNGISPAFKQQAGGHFIDVGIAEEHAISLACGIARGGGSPIVATSATFFQRGYDQIQQEMSLNSSAVTLLVFASGISGTDVTHSGTFDIPLFGNVPGLTCLAPTSGEQLLDMLAWSSGPARRPVLIRMPGEDILAYERANGGVPPVHRAMKHWPAPGLSGGLESTSASASPTPSESSSHPWSQYKVVHEGSDIALIGLGNAYPLALDVARQLREDTRPDPITDRKLGLDLSDPTIIDPQQYSTLDTTTLDRLSSHHRLMVTFEDSQLNGGWGQRISAYFAHSDVRVWTVGADMAFTDRVPVPTLKRRYGMNPGAVIAVLRRLATQECVSRGV